MFIFNITRNWMNVMKKEEPSISHTEIMQTIKMHCVAKQTLSKTYKMYVSRAELKSCFDILEIKI